VKTGLDIDYKSQNMTKVKLNDTVKIEVRLLATATDIKILDLSS